MDTSWIKYLQPPGGIIAKLMTLITCKSLTQSTGFVQINFKPFLTIFVQIAIILSLYYLALVSILAESMEIRWSWRLQIENGSTGCCL
jgi:hypothetical protein